VVHDGVFPARVHAEEPRLVAVRKEKPDSPVSPEEVGYFFGLDEENSVVSVLAGKFAAGATSNLDLAKFSKEQTTELKILAESDPVPRHVVAFRSGLGQRIVDILCQQLCAMHESEKGRQALLAFENTACFERLVDEPSFEPGDGQGGGRGWARVKRARWRHLSPAMG